jgi:hypothetical protein
MPSALPTSQHSMLKHCLQSILLVSPRLAMKLKLSVHGSLRKSEG